MNAYICLCASVYVYALIELGHFLTFDKLTKLTVNAIFSYYLHYINEISVGVIDSVCKLKLIFTCCTTHKTMHMFKDDSIIVIVRCTAVFSFRIMRIWHTCNGASSSHTTYTRIRTLCVSNPCYMSKQLIRMDLCAL